MRLLDEEAALSCGPRISLAALESCGDFSFAPSAFARSYLDCVHVPSLPSVSSSALIPPLQPPPPLVTWLLPVFNGKRFLKHAIDSIRQQQGVGAGQFG